MTTGTIEYLVAWRDASSGEIIERAEATREEAASFINTYRARAIEGMTMTFFSTITNTIVTADSAEMFELRQLANELNGGAA